MTAPGATEDIVDEAVETVAGSATPENAVNLCEKLWWNLSGKKVKKPKSKDPQSDQVQF